MVQHWDVYVRWIVWRAGYVGQNVADIGCGTAVLAMAAARIWLNPVIASDIDEVAVDVARANAAATI